MSDESKTMKMPILKLEKLGALGNVGTLGTLLYIGWMAKGAFDEQFAQVNKLADDVAELSQAIHTLEATKQTSATERGDLKEQLADIKREIAQAYGKIAIIEECLRNRRQCRL